jgi:hypothetical protein
MSVKLDTLVEKAVGLIQSLTEALDGNKDNEGFSGGIAGAVTSGFNNLTLFLQGNAAKLQDIQLNFSRQLGSTRGMAYETMQRAVDITVNNRLDRLYGFSAKNYQEGLFQVQSNLGRQVGMGIGDAGVFAAGDVLFGDKGKTMGELSANFLHLGSNMETLGESVAKMFTNAHKSGLSFQKISSSVKSHLKEVNQYGFKNGIDGLRQMAEYAEQIGMDMSQALKASSKMNSLTGATDVAARLSVLGGNFQRLANPLEMLNESLTDVESLQKRIGDMFKGAAKWDAKKGMISVSAVDRMRINEAASALGLDSGEVFKSVETQARRDLIEKQIGLGLSPELKNLIANTGTINKDGRAGIIDKDGEFRDVSEIAGNTELQAQIQDLNRTEGENISNIAQNVQSILQMMSNYQERQSNLKTQMEVGGRDNTKLRRGGVMLRHTEHDWKAEVDNEENGFINGLNNMALGLQNHAIEGIDFFKKEGIEGLNLVYGEMRDHFNALVDGYSSMGVNVDKTLQGGLEKTFKKFAKKFGINYVDESKETAGSGTVEEIGEITQGATVKAAPATAATVSPTTTSNSYSRLPYMQEKPPTNNFTININPTSKQNINDLSEGEKRQLQDLISGVVNDFYRQKEIQKNVTVGGR